MLGCGCIGGKKFADQETTKMKGKKPDENGGKQPNPHNPYNPNNPQRSSPPRNTRTPADTVDCARVTGWMLQNPQGAGRLQKQPKSAPPRPVPSPSYRCSEKTSCTLILKSVSFGLMDIF
jgi:hypothetical protein